MEKNNNFLKTKRKLSIKMSAKGGPPFTFSLPGGGSPLSPPSVTLVTENSCNVFHRFWQFIQRLISELTEALKKYCLK